LILILIFSHCTLLISDDPLILNKLDQSQIVNRELTLKAQKIIEYQTLYKKNKDFVQNK